MNQHTKELICINCPLGCPLTATIGEDGTVTNVTGNTCPRGKTYAEKELTAPTRIVTSIVRVKDSQCGVKMVSCKTRSDIPKHAIFDVIHALKGVELTAPIAIGDIILANVANTGVDVIATKEA